MSRTYPLFCVLITGAVREESDVARIRKICSLAPGTPAVFYGEISSKNLAFRLGCSGIQEIFEFGPTGEFIKELNKLQEQATFRIDLREFKIDLTRCGLWSRRYLQHITEEFNFVKYRTVDEIVSRFNISIVHLSRGLSKDGLPSPKKLLLCLKNYYAAYLLDILPNRPGKEIAEACGFASDLCLYRRFKDATGLTIGNFRKSHGWQDFPHLFLQRRTNDEKNAE